jgi:hypothetical protein
MNQSSNGQIESALEKMQNVVKQIEKYQTKKGLLALKVKNDAEIYLNMSANEMKHLPAEECAEAGVLLMQYAMFVQETYNKEMARVNWAEDEIIKVTTPDIAKAGERYSPYEERKNIAIGLNEYTIKLQELKRMAKSSVDSLYFMSNRAESVAKAFMTLAQIRKAK